MKTKLLFFLLLAAWPLRAGDLGIPNRRALLPECKVTFSIRNAGLEVTGTIEAGIVNFGFDPGDLGRSSIRATANPATLKTGIGIRDKHLQRQDYFNVAAYPQIRLVSKSFRKIGKDAFTGWFDITIKGITQEILIPFTVRRAGNTTQYRGRFEVDRLDFNLGEESTLLNRKANVFITLNLP